MKIKVIIGLVNSIIGIIIMFVIKKIRLYLVNEGLWVESLLLSK